MGDFSLLTTSGKNSLRPLQYRLPDRTWVVIRSFGEKPLHVFLTPKWVIFHLSPLVMKTHSNHSSTIYHIVLECWYCEIGNFHHLRFWPQNRRYYLITTFAQKPLLPLQYQLPDRTWVVIQSLGEKPLLAILTPKSVIFHLSPLVVKTHSNHSSTIYHIVLECWYCEIGNFHHLRFWPQNRRYYLITTLTQKPLLPL